MTGNLTELTGQEVAHYRIERRLGGGLITGVYQATDQILDRKVALKILLLGADDLTRRRFRQEARTCSALSHPHIVRTLQVGQASADGVAYIAMELINGTTLLELLDKQGTLPTEDTVTLLEPVARALHFAHSKGIVHRDVKPSNILLRYVEPSTPDSVQLSFLESAVVPLLSDFGIARALDSPDLTSTGRTVGTPSYMAPEQCAGSRDVDSRADIYSLGAVLYRCLVGRAPYIGTTTQILHAHVYEPLTIPDDILDKLPDSVIGALKNSLTKEPDERYQDVGAMAHDLRLTITAKETNVVESSAQTSDAVDEFVSHARDVPYNRNVLEGGAPEENVLPRRPARAVLPIRRSSTTHPRVTNPLPPRPLPAARKERNWTGVVIGGVMMLIVLFAALATARSLLSPPEELSSVITANATNPVMVDEIGDGIGESAVPVTDPEQIENDSSTAATSSAAGTLLAEERAAQRVGESIIGDDVDKTVNADNNVTDSSTLNNNKAGNNAATNPTQLSTELADQWDDIQSFHAQRDWQEAFESLNLIEQLDTDFEPDELTQIRFDIYMGLAAAQMQEMFQSEMVASNLANGKQQLAIAAGYYDDALEIQADSTVAKSLLNASDELAKSMVPDREGSTSQSALFALQTAYVKYSASLALLGNYCNAVEQLGVAVLIDYQPSQIDQLTRYIDNCEEPTNILTIAEESRRARRLINSSAVANMTPTTSASEQAKSIDAQRPALSAVAAPSIPSDSASGPSGADSVNFRDSLSGSILYSSVDELGTSIVWRIPTVPDSAATMLVDSARQPTMHPNGQLVTYHSDLGFAPGIRVYDQNKGEQGFMQIIYHPEASQSSPPTWNPSGDMLLFESTVFDREPRIYSALNNSIGDFLYVTDGRQPDWHPSKDLVVYKYVDEISDQAGLWLMSSNGANKQRLSDNGDDSRPVWSSYAGTIIFMSNSRSGNWDIYSTDYETQNIQQLTTDPASDGLPTVSPDGQHVAFLSNRDGAWKIWVMPILGGEPQILASIRGGLPNWLEHAIHWIR